MEDFSVGVQVPPLAPRTVVPGFRHPVTAALIVFASGVVACTPDPKDVAAALEAEIQASVTAPSPGFLDSLTPGSRSLVDGIVQSGGWATLRNRLKSDLKGAVPDQGEDAGANVVLRRRGGPGLLLVRDGHGWRLDLVLSQATFASLRDVTYPAP